VNLNFKIWVFNMLVLRWKINKFNVVSFFVNWNRFWWWLLIAKIWSLQRYSSTCSINRLFRIMTWDFILIHQKMMVSITLLLNNRKPLWIEFFLNMADLYINSRPSIHTLWQYMLPHFKCVIINFTGKLNIRLAKILAIILINRFLRW
jgi:hypothetical protein